MKLSTRKHRGENKKTKLSLTGTISGAIFTDLVDDAILGAYLDAYFHSVLQYKKKGQK